MVFLFSFSVGALAGPSAPSFAAVQSLDGIPTFVGKKPISEQGLLFRQIIGAANDFKEGDVAIGVGALDLESRMGARTLISNTKVTDYLNLISSFRR